MWVLRWRHTGPSQSLRALQRDNSRRSVLALGLGIAVLAGWLWWFLDATVSVYEISSSARLETDVAVHRVAAPVEGLIVATALTVGRTVEPGEVLLELDAVTQRSELEREEARLTSLHSQLEALLAEIAVEERRVAEVQQTGKAQLLEARAQLAQGEAAAADADREVERNTATFASGASSGEELSRWARLLRFQIHYCNL